ncbi:hypothetical protein, partial [Xanthomonas cerealis]|uniref:hypothetical protein n=1 Tax=Xanthomonas cerealis TaxID=3390025 RepID=UPI001C3FF94B
YSIQLSYGRVVRSGIITESPGPVNALRGKKSVCGAGQGLHHGCRPLHPGEKGGRGAQLRRIQSV